MVQSIVLGSSRPVRILTFHIFLAHISWTLYVVFVFVQILTLYFVSLADTMPRLSEMVSKKPKPRSKRVTREEKRKTPVEDKSSVLEHEASLLEPGILKKPEVQKKPEAPKQKGVVFKEPAPQTYTSVIF